ncbi:MAG TPA: RICIN domain-containing protein [Pseudonocardiaceae bacterium]|nr:RICIN domain-containing protein [Pseudonocardiaceae bacterium]
MGDQLVPDGTYTVMGPGGMLTDLDGAIVVFQPGEEKNQQWEVKFDSGTYTLRNMATGAYLGNDGDPNQGALQVKGTRQPYTWKLSTGNDDSEETLLLTSAASQDGLVLTNSPLRIYPPQLAILPPDKFGPPAEWVLARV